MVGQNNLASMANPESTLLSDHDFERLKADVFDNNLGLGQSAPQGKNIIFIYYYY